MFTPASSPPPPGAAPAREDARPRRGAFYLTGAGCAAGAGAVVPAGGAGLTTEPRSEPPRIVSANEVSTNTKATMPVIFVSRVGVPIDPKTAWVPAPPN